MRIFIRAFLISTITIMMVGCGGGNSSNKGYSEGIVKIMPLGDSITYDDAIAYYDAHGKNLVPAGKRTGYRSFLAYALNDANIKYDFVGSKHAGYNIEPPFDPDNEGHPGWTSAKIASHVYTYLNNNTADIILLHIGTNDHSSSIKGVKKILSEIKRFEDDHKIKIKVFVALIINRWTYDHNIKSFNENLKTYLDSLDNPNIIEVDMQTILHGREGDYLENTHPSKKGYKKMADKWFSAIIDYI